MSSAGDALPWYIGSFSAVKESAAVAKKRLAIDNSAALPEEAIPKFWSLHEEGAVLVARYSGGEGDQRVAFYPGLYRDYGNHGQGESGEDKEIGMIGAWRIYEAAGILVIRDTTATEDRRFAFWPGRGNHNFGAVAATPHTNLKVHFRGHRWVIREEGGILVFRDILTEGDHRYAFYPFYLDH